MLLAHDDPLAVEVAEAITAGAVERLAELLDAHPGLALARVAGAPGEPAGVTRTLLHLATDWPGHRPRTAEVIGLLVARGADVHARFTGPHTETPLHWAASNDDVPALDALLDAGADPEADGAVIAGGTALSDAVAFAQWRAARRLVERGARSRPFESAALGLVDRLPGDLPAEELGPCLWAAAHGGQRAVAEVLLARGADAAFVAPWDGLSVVDAARRQGHHALADWLAAAPH